jgi:TolB-like protein/Tfp pilus assembly protein PilF
VLVERSGQEVSKEELLEAVWPDTVVEESNLTVHMSNLRKALGETPEDHRYIVTISGRGYRFVAPVKVVAAAGGTTDAEPAGPVVESEALGGGAGSRRRIPPVLLAACAVIGIAAITTLAVRLSRSSVDRGEGLVPQLAVLPFKLIGGGSGDEYLTLGLADALITRLGAVPELRVRPTSAVLKYQAGPPNPRTAGKELGVESLLEGEIQHSDSRVRVTVKLVSAKDGVALWASKFDAEFVNVFALEDQISEQVAEQLLRKLTAADRRKLSRTYTPSAEGHELYLRGRYFWSQDTEESLGKSLEYFTKAVAQDPNYSLAHAAIAEAYVEMAIQGYLSGTEALPNAKQAALRAQELDSGLAEAHSVLGVVAWAYDWDWRSAESESRRAVELNPNSATVAAYRAFELATAGRFDEAISEGRRAVDLDPTSLSITQEMAYLQLLARRLDDSVIWSRRALELDSRALFARVMLVTALSLSDKHSEAMTEYRGIASGSLTGREQLAGAYAAFACVRAGEPREARKIRDNIQREEGHRYVDPYLLAAIASSLGEHDAELRWLNQAYQQRSMSMVFLGVEPLFDAARGQPRVRSIVDRVGLPFVR